MTNTTQQVPWGDLRKGDHIFCPGDGVEERVDRVERRRTGSTFVRTSRHDHLRPTGERVTRRSKA